jgi:dGTPase
VVDELEAKYADFPGLNLMFETREGILKHCSKKNARALGDVGERFLNRTQPGLEAQLADICDAVAYNNHDVDDGYRAGLISLDQLREQPLFESHYSEVILRYPNLEDRRLIYEIIRRMINTVVTDLIETTKRNLDEAGPASIDDVRAAGRPLVGFSAEIGEQHRLLKQFLHQHLYSHEQKLEMTRKVQTVLQDLFETFMTDVNRMPGEFATAAEHGDDAARARVVADYIAGMTDRYAFAEHKRISG